MKRFLKNFSGVLSLATLMLGCKAVNKLSTADNATAKP